MVDNDERRLAAEKFRLVVEACPNGMLIIDGAGKMVMVNAEIEQQFGYRCDELVGQPVDILVPARLRGPQAGQDAAFIGGRQARRIGTNADLAGLRKDGGEFPIEIGLTPINVGDDILILGVIVNISERKDAEKHLAQMELKYRKLLEAAPDAIVVVNDGGEIVLLNVQAEKQFGYSREELVGQKVKSIIPEGFEERLVVDGTPTTAEALAEQVGTGIELIGRRKDGTGFPMELMLSPLESAEGILVTAAIRALGARKETEKHVAKMEGRYRGLLEAAPDAMVVVNKDGEIVLLNLQAEKQFGYSHDELMGQMIKIIIPGGSGERPITHGLRSKEDALTLRISTEIELHGRRKDGTEFPMEVMLRPLESAEEILVIRDISARKHVEHLKEEFVATVSHELRTPLTSISGSLGLLVGRWAGKLPESAARLLDIAHKNSQRLVRLVNDILDIEKMESGRVVFNISRIDVSSVIEQAIEDTRSFAIGYDVRVRTEFSSSIGKVDADPDRLIQVVTNLLSNAIKFSPVGGEVLVASESSNGMVRISVRDRGIGIPAEFKPRIFEKFAQADATGFRPNGGTGLGLSIVKQVVERLGGEVGFADNVGGGAIFYIELPACESSLDPSVSGQKSRPRIIHIDDDQDVLALVSYSLQATADVVSVVSLADARCALATDRIDLVVLDASLGEDIDAALQSGLCDNSGEMVPVIVFSAAGANLACDKVPSDSGRSQATIENLETMIRDHLIHGPVSTSKECA